MNQTIRRMSPVLSTAPDYEVEAVKERAMKRAERRIEEREHLRLEIESRRLIQDMQEAAFKLMFGFEPSLEDNTVMVPLTRDRIAGIKAGADVADKLLKKVLPDLKQVEMNTNDKTNGEKVLESIDIANRLRIYLQAIQQRDAQETKVVSEGKDFLD